MKKKIRIILICLIAFAILYVGESLYISKKVHSIVVNSYDNYGKTNTKSAIVSDDIYNRMCYRSDYSVSSQNNPEVIEKNKLDFPLTIHWFFGGKVYYHYTYEIEDKNGEVLAGSSGIPVTVDVKLSNGKWIITNKYEAP